MKYLVAFLAIACFVAARDAGAQVTHYDSVSLGHPLILSSGVTDTAYIFGSRDGNSAHFGNTGYIADRFWVGSNIITMQKGQPIHVYWNIPKLSPGDSNLARVHLQRLSEDGNFIPYGDTAYYVYEPPVLNTEGMVTIIVPDTGYNAIGVELAVDVGANSFWLDAITLVQSGDAAVASHAAGQAPLLSSYPNPIEHNSRATVHIASSASGQGILSISDAMGREVERLPIGELSISGEDAAVTLDQSGVYFVRLLIDGVPFGTPLKLIAE